MNRKVVGPDNTPVEVLKLDIEVSVKMSHVLFRKT